jgi:uncharacterized protein YjeT (DUF2065 family)
MAGLMASDGGGDGWISIVMLALSVVAILFGVLPTARAGLHDLTAPRTWREVVAELRAYCEQVIRAVVGRRRLGFRSMFVAVDAPARSSRQVRGPDLHPVAGSALS